MDFSTIFTYQELSHVSLVPPVDFHPMFIPNISRLHMIYQQQIRHTVFLDTTNMCWCHSVHYDGTTSIFCQPLVALWTEK